MRGTGIAIASLMLAGCPKGAAPTNRASDPAPATVDAAPTPTPYPLPAYVPGPAYDTECVDFPTPRDAEKSRRGHKRYDFAARPLPIDPGGVRMTERSRAGYARSPLVVDDLIAERHDEVEGCWRWWSAKAKRPADTALTLSLEIDPWGRVDQIVVDGGAAELRGCVEGAFAGTSVLGMSTRRTTARATLAFTIEQGLKKWKKKPRRPALEPLPAPHVGKQCAPVLRDAEAQEIVLARAFAFTDWDQSRVPPAPKGTRKAAAPVVRLGCSEAQEPDLDKATIRAMIDGNAGALGACHVAARERDPSLRGEVETPFVIGTSGGVLAGPITGAGDAALHDCLREALEEVWFHPATREIQVAWVWSLDPSQEDATPHPDTRLAALAAELGADPGGPEACLVRGELLVAMMDRAPWLDDARVRAVLADLIADAASRPEDEARACIEAVRQPLRRLEPGTGDFTYGVEERAAFYEMVQPIRGYLSADVPWKHVEALALFDRPAALLAGDAYLAEHPDEEWRRGDLETLRTTGALASNRCLPRR